MRLLGRRFDKCGRAAKVLDYETPQRKEEQRRKKDSCLNHADCTPDCGSGCDPSGVTDGCDLVTSVAGGSCDAGGCDLSV